ncbi:aspartyl/glutamyl-tRNA amidotransferase subunit A [candidate division WOR-1 bacterium RIFOXYB2_FULL_42_35]|uniref:Glutamyl-tRNA(Gln) amidotransferase subunit A n=1 Tax=candidate division WOR-1 bacterium RIFOXYC2_FULL_41_25 TaxID=1802586 RepID=A0A1F4TLX4_UNCSA|nr:MAG: aspartyl/glutamyl-tRNA amidotransferase subunit A [candidate division WOR-1 bacterium RIFOXYA2_FULL_41_14]OGC23595.1 MAG: aspartyl/glutamyl-tRNA amidotransferase subunit A [candidate division WOR-1 bacterium RIFOXYB2_FULL_42_35]OGC33559.1 MAG: aspartyl/glutamyl-tRNA amidotransferase subunit A [candidate division WOR-1 bacterium RIFOXYC2_FULL_41_25]
MNNKTAHELHNELKNKKISSVELTEAVFAQIEKVESKVQAFVTLTKEEALKQAKAADERIENNHNLTPLTGIPIAIKDNMCTKGILTTCSSKILSNYLPPYNATIVEKLKEAGAIMVGKTNMDEFAMGSSTENSGLHPTNNPWNLNTVPGGSSGGSAAAVAADECILATGSDTGGSIRQPAAFCGVVGLKPTYGRVSRYGLVAFASSLDQIGPLTKDVTDTATVLNIISGHDPKDSTSVNISVPDYQKSLINNIKGLKIGYIKELLGKGIDKEVKVTIEKAMKKLAELGAELIEVSMPSFEAAVATYYLIAPAEASSNLARYDGVKFGHRSKEAKDLLTMYYNTRQEGFGTEVKRRILLGTYALSAGYYDAYYLKALKVRTLIKQDFDKAFAECDVLISPTAPTVAFKIGEKTADPLSMYLSDIATIPVNLAGLPGISLPCGFSNNLPVGLQIIGKAFAEETILRVAFTYEQNTDWHKKKPQL